MFGGDHYHIPRIWRLGPVSQVQSAISFFASTAAKARLHFTFSSLNNLDSDININNNGHIESTLTTSNEAASRMRDIRPATARHGITRRGTARRIVSSKTETEPVEEGRYKGYVKELADLEKGYEVEGTLKSGFMPTTKAANGRRRR